MYRLFVCFFICGLSLFLAHERVTALVTQENIPGEELYLIEPAGNRVSPSSIVLETVSVVHDFTNVPYLAVSAHPNEIQELSDSGVISNHTRVRKYVPTTFNSSTIVNATKVQKHAFPVTGSGVAVAIIDTGVDKTHTAFFNSITSTSRVTHEFCVSNVSQIGASLCPSGSPTPTTMLNQIGSGVPCTNSSSVCSHGTHVAGISSGKNSHYLGTPVSGIAPESSIIAIAAFLADTTTDPSVYTTDIEILAGLDYLIGLSDSGVTIASVNMSLGTPEVASNATECANLLYIPTALTNAVTQLANRGVAVVVSAGNAGNPAGVGAPGCLSNVLTVASSTKSDGVSSFSNTSSLSELFAPGDTIYSALPGGSYGYKSGTSMAAPQVAGAIALIRSALPSISISAIYSGITSAGPTITDSRGIVPVSLPRLDVAGTFASIDALLGVAPETDVSFSGSTYPLVLSFDSSDDVAFFSSPFELTVDSVPTNASSTALGLFSYSGQYSISGPGLIVLRTTDSGGHSATNTIVAPILPTSSTTLTYSVSSTSVEPDQHSVHVSSPLVIETASSGSSLLNLLNEFGVTEQESFAFTLATVTHGLTNSLPTILSSNSSFDISLFTPLSGLSSGQTLYSISTSPTVAISGVTVSQVIHIGTNAEPFLFGGLATLCISGSALTTGTTYVIYSSADGVSWSLDSTATIVEQSVATCATISHASFYSFGTVMLPATPEPVVTPIVISSPAASSGGGGGGSGSSNTKVTTTQPTVLRSAITTVKPISSLHKYLDRVCTTNGTVNIINLKKLRTLSRTSGLVSVTPTSRAALNALLVARGRTASVGFANWRPSEFNNTKKVLGTLCKWHRMVPIELPTKKKQPTRIYTQ